MRTAHRRLPSRWSLALLGGLLAAGPGSAGADTGQTHLSRLDDRSAVVHALPRRTDDTRMLAERVVLVPFLGPDREPRVLVHVWYDLATTGPARTLAVGFPELRAVRDHSSYWAGGAGGGRFNYTERSRDLDLPTIERFSARVGERWLPVHEHPGVGPYRRWLVHGLPLAPGGPTRLHELYVSRVGRHLEGKNPARDPPEQIGIRYWFSYLLHTGATWAGTIGSGEVVILHEGRHRVLRRFRDLEPTRADDVHLELPVTRTLTQTEESLVRGLDHLQLVQWSSHLETPELDALGALALDGDPDTRWRSARSSALGAWVQVPLGESGTVETVTLTSGVPAAGETRPARITLGCANGKGAPPLVTADLPDTVGPHRIALPSPRRCWALRVRVDAVHGDPKAPVGIADLAVQLAGPEPTGPGLMLLAAPPLARVVAGIVGTAPGAPPAIPAGPERTGTWEIARVSGVRFSPDGTLTFHRVWLENRALDPGGVVAGFFTETASGRRLRTVRLDALGALPPDLEQEWPAALTLDEAEAFMARHGFVDAVATRFPPRAAVTLGHLVELTAEAPRALGRLAVTPRPLGWAWRFDPNPAAAAGAAGARLRLVLKSRGSVPRDLREHRPRLDPRFALTHLAVRARRRPAFDEAVKQFVEERAGYVEPSAGAKAPEVWYARTYPHAQAFTGEVTLYWHPAGHAVLAALGDRQEWSSLTADPKPEELESECAALTQSICPWDQRDHGRERLAVSVHALAALGPAPLAAALPAAPAPAPAATPRAPDAGVARPQDAGPGRRAAPARRPGSARSGCGCRAAGPGPDLGLLGLLGLLALLALARRRRSAPRASGVR